MKLGAAQPEGEAVHAQGDAQKVTLRVAKLMSVKEDARWVDTSLKKLDRGLREVCGPQLALGARASILNLTTYLTNHCPSSGISSRSIQHRPPSSSPWTIARIS